MKGDNQMKKAMLSQPMAGKTDAEIVETRERAIKALEEKGMRLSTRSLRMNGIAQRK